MQAGGTRIPSTPPFARSEGEERDSVTTAEGPSRGRGDGAGAGGSRRASRSEAEGTPKGLARPRSAEAAQEHAGDFEEGR